MQTKLKVQLSTFMFLQYFIWGSWYVSMGSYLKDVLQFDGGEIGLAYSAFAIGAMIAPFFVGLVADRYFASEKMLGVLGLLGGGIMFLLPEVPVGHFWMFFALLLLYCATYVPTLALGNSLSLHQLKNSKVDFPRVKVFSAVGWIAGGVVLSRVGVEFTHEQFYVAGGLSVVFGLFSFTLPYTPPRKTGRASVGEILGLDALGLLKKWSFAVFIVCMFLICIPLYSYFVNLHIYLGELGWKYVTEKMALAQVSDVVFLFLLPVMLRSLGYKTTIFLGIVAWVTRFFFLAQSAKSYSDVQLALIFAAICLHGICYDFLFIAGQLYVDGESTEKNRGAAQGFIAFILWGVGGFVGTTIAGQVQGMNAYKNEAGVTYHNWQAIWLVPAIMAS